MLIRTALTTFLLVASLAACDDDDDGGELAALRVVHASPDAPPVDILLDPGTGPIITGLAYGQASPYIDVVPDNYTVIVRVAGSDTVVFETELAIDDEDDVVTAIATGYVGSTDASNSFRILPLFEDFGNVPEDDAALRIVHASPDAPTVDIDIVDTETIETATLARFDDTGDDAVLVPANEMFQVEVASDGTPVTAFTTPSLPGRAHLFVIAIGNVTDLPRVSTGFSLLVVGPEGVVTTVLQNPTVYALHAAPDAPAVDVRAGATGAVVIADLTFGELVPVQVPPGDYTLAVFPAGDASTPVGTTDVLALNPGERYLAVAAGLLAPRDGEQRFAVGVYLEQLSLGAAGPILRVIHAVPDAPLVDVSNANGTTLATPPLFGDLSFLEASAPDGTAVAASSSFRLGVAPARTTAAAATFAINTTSVERAFGVLAGTLTPAAGEQPLQLFVIETAVTPWSITSVPPLAR